MGPMLPTPIREPVEPTPFTRDRMVPLSWLLGFTAQVPNLLPKGDPVSIAGVQEILPGPPKLTRHKAGISNEEG